MEGQMNERILQQRSRHRGTRIALLVAASLLLGVSLSSCYVAPAPGPYYYAYRPYYGPHYWGWRHCWRCW
jgi:hypothetical protein